MSSAAKNFDVLVSLSVLHNYFDDPIKLFLDLYLAKFLDASTKLSFLCSTIRERERERESAVR